MEPFTLTALVGAAVGGVVGNHSDRVVLALRREVSARIGGFGGLPRNHGAAHVLRRAQLRALKLVLDDYYQDGMPGWFAPPNVRQAVMKDARRFVSDRLKFCESIMVDDAMVAALQAALTPVLNATPTPSMQAAEEAVLAELSTALAGEALPMDFLDRFHGRAKGKTGWADAFSALVADALKNDAPFRHLFTVTTLSGIDEGLADLTATVEEFITRLANKGEALRERLEEIGAGVDAANAKLDSLEAGLARTQEQVEKVIKFLGSGSLGEQRIRELESELNATRAEVVGLISSLLDQDIPPQAVLEHLPQAREKLATVHRELLDLRKIVSYVPEIESDLQAARLALTQQHAVDMVEAERHLAAVSEYLEILFSRRRALEEENLVNIYETRADLALASGRILDAAELYERAASKFGSLNSRRRTDLLWSQAICLFKYGDMHTDNKWLIRGIEIMKKEVIPGIDPRSETFRWATANNDVSNHLRLLGHRIGGEYGMRLLRESTERCGHGINIVNRDNDPVSWAKMSMTLGASHCAIADFSTNGEKLYHLARSTACYREAADVLSSNGIMLEYAECCVSLAIVLGSLGESFPETADTAFRESVDFARKGVDIAKNTDNVLFRIKAFSNLATSLYWLSLVSNQSEAKSALAESFVLLDQCSLGALNFDAPLDAAKIHLIRAYCFISSGRHSAGEERKQFGRSAITELNHSSSIISRSNLPIHKLLIDSVMQEAFKLLI